MRKPIMITNTDRSGNVMDGKWYVRVGRRWKIFGQRDWKTSGIDWINRQLGS